MSDYAFYHAQLLGRQPECTPGTPHEGFYMLRRMHRWKNTDQNRKPGDPRTKQREVFIPVAIWRDDRGWQCRIGREGSFEYLTDADEIDNIFSRACRSAITHEEYEREVRNAN